MASGTIKGTTSNEYIDMQVVWSSTPNTEENKSTVKAVLCYKRNNTGYTTYGTGTFSITINGKKTSVTKSVTISEFGWVEVVEATVSVDHNGDGTKSIAIRASGSIPDTTLTSSMVVANVTLDTIPRATSFDSLTCSTSYFTGKITYRYTPKSSSLYNGIDVTLNPYGENKSLMFVAIGKKSASQQTNTLSLAESVISTIYNALPSATKGTLRFTFSTYADSDYTESIGSSVYKDITLNIPNTTDTQPTATMTLSPISSLDAPFDALYIKGRTKVDANFTNGQGKYGASIVSYSMTVDGKSYGSPYTSRYLSTVGDITVTGKVTDSRGFSRTYTKTITVISYGKPSILPASGESEIICARCDDSGNLSESGTNLKIKARRSYSKVTSGGVQNNFCLIRYRYREESTNTFSSWKTLLAKTTTSTDTIDTTLSGVVSSADTAYFVQIGVVDDIGESDAVQIPIPSDFVTMDVPEKHKGKRVGLLRYARDTDKPGIDVGAPIHGGCVDNLTLGEMITATSSAPIDLNDIKTPGNYYSPSADNSQYITNSPYTSGGFSLIVRELQSANMIRQELFFGRTNWQRHYSSVDGTWSEWLRYLMTTYPETTAADFVTETGVWNIDDNDTDKGYWRYRKWKSGAVDMNGFIKVFPVTEGTLGTAGVYYSETINIDLPFEVANFQFVGSGTAYHIFVGNTNSVDGNGKQVRLRLYRFTDFSGLVDYDVYIRIVASGKLK